MIIAALALAYFIWESRFSTEEASVADQVAGESQVTAAERDQANDERRSIAVLTGA